jgi:ubiquinone biosynthesis protein
MATPRTGIQAQHQARLEQAHRPKDVHESAPDDSTLTRSARLLRFATRYRHLLLGGQPAEGEGADPAQLARDIQALGPAFIKIGQALSIRPDLLPPRYLEALQCLQDDVERVPFEQIRARVEEELGVRITQGFARFEQEPLAAASLAQVHAATLRDGREVVVKVQRPGIDAAIQGDLAVLRGIARTADRFTEQGRRVHFAEWIDEISETLAEELDYRLEADNLRAFREHLSDYPALSVPAPVADYSSARVLTMDRMPGDKVTSAIELKRLDEPLERYASELIHAYLDQIFLHGLVHADPHPGNVLLSDCGLGLVDLGMVMRIGPKMRDSLLRLLAAVADGDGDEVARQVMDLSEQLEMFDERVWRRRCSRLVTRFHGRSDRGSAGEGGLMIELTRLGAECGLRPPPEVAVLGRTLLALEGVACLLDPVTSPRALVRRHLDHVLAERARQQLSLHSLQMQAADVAEAIRDAPRQARDVLAMLAQNRLRIRLTGLEESRLLENLQKIANRISAGLISAALVVGAALALRIDAGPRLFGYPGIALVLFVLAFLLSATLVMNSLMSDRRMSRYRARER